MRGKLFVVSGPSGVGKNTLLNAIIDSCKTVQYSVSATSRPIRPGEVDGKSYYFVSRARFEELIANDALLEYARRIKDREALIVLATDEHAMEERHITTIRRITRTHPMVLIDVATMNPFKAVSSRHAPTDGLSARRVPAFLRNAKAAAEVDTHRAYMAAALEQELTRAGSHIIRSASSESMFDRFVALVSRALARTTRNRLGTAPELVGLTLAGDL